MTYANGYTVNILNRLKAENPDFFERSGKSFDEMTIDLTNKMCAPVQMVYAQQFRQTLSNIKEKEHTTDTIRRLNNGGDKFHPYL